VEFEEGLGGRVCMDDGYRVLDVSRWPTEQYYVAAFQTTRNRTVCFSEKKVAAVADTERYYWLVTDAIDATVILVPYKRRSM
jgi:hypothetical protein